MALKNLTGQRFGRLLVISCYSAGTKIKTKWLCQCDCGFKAIVRSDALQSGGTKSCGCFKMERDVIRHTKHGMHKTRIYKSWEQMMQRCYNPNNAEYYNSGGRGITVCERWNKFENFYADMGEMPEGLTLERKNVNGNYELENCKWATYKEQANNRRNNTLVEYNGVVKTIGQWEQDLGYKRSVLRNRLKYGWSVEKAFGGNLC